MLGVIALMHVVGFGVLVLAVAPQHFSLGAQVFSVGLGLTAYAFGLRHAFDADHLAAIDNTTRKLRGEGVRSSSVGFWFAMGHSSLVFVMAALVSVGAHAVSGLTDETSPVRTMFRTVASLGSSGFLYLIGLVNMIALVALLKVWAGLRRGEFDQDTFESHLQRRGFLTRILNRFMKSIRRPWHMFSVGAIFGLSFDTATEIALLVLAGTGAAQGVPWYAIMVLPMLFAAGMTLLDWMNGLFMTGAYDWAYVRPARKVFYNLAITGISVAVAVLMGTIQLAHFLQETYSWTNPLIDAVTAVNVNVLGFFIIGICLAVWAVAALYWKAADVDGESAEASAASDEKGR